MARYKLVSVKYSRREHKKDAQGNLMYRDDDKKQPVYELKSYGIGETVDLSPAEAKRLRKDIQPIGGTSDQPTPLQFVPDDDNDGIVALNARGDDNDDNDPKIAAVLSGNVDQVLAYINDHEDDDETLEALREAEMEGKARKGVLDALNALLGE